MKKFIMLISAIAMTVGFTMTAFAMQKGWNFENDQWKYSKNGEEFVSNEWAKSGENWYFLGEDEVMLVNQVVEDNDHLYFVDPTGAMVKNAWVKTAIEEDDEDKWMYFGMSGKAVKDDKKDINGKSFIFKDNYMLTGFVTEDLEAVDENEEFPYQSAMYFCGGEDDGYVAKEQWIQTNGEDGLVWLYFKKNGKKMANGKMDIDGKTYVFNADGSMKVGFSATPSVASDSIAKYTMEDGSVVKKGWIWALDEDEEDYHWFYAKGNGNLLKGCVKDINGKKYAFNSKGEMLTGFVVVDDEKNVVGDEATSIDDIEPFFQNPITADGIYGYMYFAENEDKMLQGAGASGLTKFEVNGETYTVNFTSYGIAKCEGPQVKKNKLYDNGVLIQARDYSYVPYNPTNGKFECEIGVSYLVSKSGVVKKNAKGVKDGDSTKYWTDAEGKITQTENY